MRLRGLEDRYAKLRQACRPETSGWLCSHATQQFQSISAGRRHGPDAKGRRGPPRPWPPYCLPALASDQCQTVSEYAPEPNTPLWALEVHVEAGVHQKRQPVRENPDKERRPGLLSSLAGPDQACEHA